MTTTTERPARQQARGDAHAVQPRPRRTLADRERAPSGKPADPVVLLSGEELSGKTWTALEFTGSQRVGPSWLIQLGEADGDPYGAIPGARFKLLDHDGTWQDIMDTVDVAIEAAHAARAAGEGVPVLIFDSMSKVWELLSTWAENRARHSTANQAKLAKDPNADVDVGHLYWNAANRRHRQLVTKLRTWPGIVILTARGKWVTKMDGKGNPTKEREYTLEAQKELGFRVTAWVRLSRDANPFLVGARLAAGAPSNAQNYGRGRPMPGFSLEEFIFTTLGYDPDGTESRREVAPVAGNEADPSVEDQVPVERPALGAEATLTRRPSPRVGELDKMITESKTMTDLAPVWQLIVSAVRNGEITEDEGNALRAAYKARGEVINQEVAAA